MATMKSEHWGVAGHGEEVIIADAYGPGTQETLLSFKLPKNVNVITMAYPGEMTSSFELSWFVKLVKESSQDYLDTLFQQGSVGRRERHDLEKILNLGIGSMTQQVFLDLYTGQQGNKPCPDIVLHTTNKTRDAKVNDRLSRVPWLHVYPLKTLLDKVQLPLSLFIKRDSSQTGREAILHTLNRAAVESHPCTDIVCNIQTKDEFPTKDNNRNKRGMKIRKEGCVQMLKYTSQSDLDELRGFCIYSRDRMLKDNYLAPLASNPPANPNPQNQLANQQILTNVNNLYGVKHDFQAQINPSNSENEIKKKEQEQQEQRKHWNDAARWYVHQRLFFSRKLQLQYGDPDLDADYSNSRFLLSEFIHDKCADPHVRYNIFLLCCRERHSRTMTLSVQPSALPHGYVLTDRNTDLEERIKRAAFHNRVNFIRRSQVAYHKKLGNAIFRDMDDQTNVGHIQHVRTALKYPKLKPVSKPKTVAMKITNQEASGLSSQTSTRKRKRSDWTESNVVGNTSGTIPSSSNRHGAIHPSTRANVGHTRNGQVGVNHAVSRSTSNMNIGYHNDRHIQRANSPASSLTGHNHAVSRSTSNMNIEYHNDRHLQRANSPASSLTGHNHAVSRSTSNMNIEYHNDRHLHRANSPISSIAGHNHAVSRSTSNMNIEYHNDRHLHRANSIRQTRPTSSLPAGHNQGVSRSTSNMNIEYHNDHLKAMNID